MTLLPTTNFFCNSPVSTQPISGRLWTLSIKPQKVHKKDGVFCIASFRKSCLGLFSKKKLRQNNWITGPY